MVLNKRASFRPVADLALTQPSCATSSRAGEYVEELGLMGSIEAETVGILMEHGVATRPFTAEVGAVISLPTPFGVDCS